jgi:hypothetical protein
MKIPTEPEALLEYQSLQVARENYRLAKGVFRTARKELKRFKTLVRRRKRKENCKKVKPGVVG